MPINLHHSYTVRIYWSDKTFCFHASCVEIPSISVQGINRNSVLDAVDTQIDAVVKRKADSIKTEIEPIAAKKYKGKIPLRVSPSTHRLLAVHSAEEGLSMNSLISSIIDTNLKGRGKEKFSLFRLEYKVNELKIINNRLYNDIHSLLDFIRKTQE